MKIYILSIPSLLFYRISSPSSSHTPHPSSFIHYLLFLLPYAPSPPPPTPSPPLPLSLTLHLSYISSPHSSFPSLTHFPSPLAPPPSCLSSHPSSPSLDHSSLPLLPHRHPSPLLSLPSNSIVKKHDIVIL